ncbi:MAG TPA: hypothetical protein VFC34_13630 [Puia sp.]|nr:hypothetical protein [Puia sp.]
MDTDDLSRETYEAIIITAERFHHDLTLQFGINAEGCATDDEFLERAVVMIGGWLKEPDTDGIIDDIFFDNPPDKDSFRDILQSIKINISKVKEIQIGKRHFDSC